MRLIWTINMAISYLFTLALLNKSPQTIELFAVLVSNLISGYLGYIVRQLEE